jgi:calcium-dependent protein kinase
MSGFSKEAVSLQEALMNPNPGKRIDAETALKSDWIKKAMRGDYASKDLGDALQNLQNFQSGGRLKQAMNGFFTQMLMSQKELNNLTAQFKTFDKNGNGTLSREELIDAYVQTRGINFNQKDVDTLIKQIDLDGSGDISYSEWVSVAMGSEKLIA